MPKIEWKYVLNLNQFKAYFNINDLIQLSIVCKKFRISLSPYIFDSFNFGSFVSNRNYITTIISEEVNDTLGNFTYLYNPYIPLKKEHMESKDRFVNDLDFYSRNINNLVIENVQDYYYLICEIPKFFGNITSLVIDNTTTTLDLFQYLLNNFSCLEELTLTHSKIHKRIKDLNNNSVNWPTTLKKLAIGSNLVGYVDERGDSAILSPNINFDEGYSEFVLLPSKLTNLTSLIYMPSTYDEGQYDDGDNGSELFEFLKLNQNIKQLHIRDINITPMLLNLIKSLQNLTHLYLYDYKYFFDIDTAMINSPVQNCLRFLEIYLPTDNDILHTLARQFPNLSCLNIISSNSAFSSLCSIISKFNKLKTFKLVDHSQLHKSNKLNIQNYQNLESVEFLAYFQTKFELFNFNVNNCPKLKFIKFEKCDYAEEFAIPDLPPELKKEWSLVYFPHKLLFYKINQ